MDKTFSRIERLAVDLLRRARSLHYVAAAHLRGSLGGNIDLSTYLTSKQERLLTWYSLQIDITTLLLQRADGGGLGPVSESAEALRLKSVRAGDFSESLCVEKRNGLETESTIRGLKKMTDLWSQRPESLSTISIVVQATGDGGFRVIDGRHRTAIWMHHFPNQPVPAHVLL